MESDAVVAEFFKILSENWNVLSSAPLASIVLVLIGVAAGRWFRYTFIEELKERLKNSEDRFKDLNERAGFAPRSGSEFACLRNVELRQRTLREADDLRNWLETLNTGNHDWLEGFHRKPKEEQSRIWKAHTDAVMRESGKPQSTYEAKFKVNSTLLRDEIITRLPPKTDPIEDTWYERPINQLGMQMVANDLERLAKLLPVPPGLRTRMFDWGHWVGALVRLRIPPRRPKEP